MHKETHAFDLPTSVSTTQKFADERLQEHGLEVLFRCQDIDATDIKLTVINGVAHLSGAVQDEEAVVMAESCLKNIPEIRSIENGLEVRRAEDLS